MSVVEGKRPPKPKDASDVGFSDSLWDFVRRCWDGRSELRPTVTEVVSQLGIAAAAWSGFVAPHALIAQPSQELINRLDKGGHRCNS